jgi:hypothetical protein
MNNIVLSPSKFGFIVVTRAALAAGVGLLVSQRLSESQLSRVGKTLVAVGVLATIPSAMFLAKGRAKH